MSTLYIGFWQLFGIKAHGKGILRSLSFRIQGVGVLSRQGCIDHTFFWSLQNFILNPSVSLLSSSPQLLLRKGSIFFTSCFPHLYPMSWPDRNVKGILNRWGRDRMCETLTLQLKELCLNFPFRPAGLQTSLTFMATIKFRNGSFIFKILCIESTVVYRFLYSFTWPIPPKNL